MRNQCPQKKEIPDTQVRSIAIKVILWTLSACLLLDQKSTEDELTILHAQIETQREIIDKLVEANKEMMVQEALAKKEQESAQLFKKLDETSKKLTSDAFEPYYEPVRYFENTAKKADREDRSPGRNRGPLIYSYTDYSATL